MKGEQSSSQFYLAGAVSILLGVFSLSLPHTPPKKVGHDVTIGQVLGFDALGLMKKPSFAIFIGCMFLICIPLYFYFVMMSIYLTELQWTGLVGKMTLAQVSDVIFLFLLPLMLKHFGYKKTIFIGILAWAARYLLLAGSVNALTLQTSLIFAAIVLHGVCYDFLFIAGQLYVDDEANERIRGACQGFIAFILWGVGAYVGTMLAEIRTMNTMLTAIDDKPQHSYATPCGQHLAGGVDYLPALRASGLLRYTRAADPSARPLDPMNVPARFFPENATGADLIAAVQEADGRGGMIVLGFHGVGGDYLSVPAQAHAQLLAYLKAHSDTIWVAPFSTVMDDATSHPGH
jgi:hypothetical protein